jgi:O-antigen/teichoic acid export membrane protein
MLFLSGLVTRALSHLGMQEGGLKRYLHNTGWFLFTRICSLVVAFFTTVYVIRYLGPENYGTLSYAVSFVSLFGFIASLGIDQIVYRELVKRPEDEAQIMGSALSLKLLGGLTATLLAIGSAIILGVTQIELILISIVSLTLFGAAGQIFTYVYQAKVQSKYPALITLSISFILAIVKLLVIYFDKGLIYFALVLLLESLLYAVFFAFSYQKHFKMLQHWKADKSTMQTLFATSWPLMLSTVSIMIYARIDQVMLRHYIDTTAVGIYDAAVRLADVWYIIPNVILGALFPAIINAQKSSPNLFRKRIQMCAALLVGLNLLIIIPTNILAPYIIETLFGNSFIGTADVLTIYIWSLIGFSLGQLMNTYLIAENYIYIYLYTSVGTVIVNVLLNIWWIPLYGVNGAALATLVSYSLIPILPFGFKKIRVQLLTLTKHEITI